MIINLKGKHALIGGSSSGIGFGVAYQLAAAGASVTLMSRSEPKLQIRKNQLPIVNDEQKHHFIIVDFNDYPSFETRITQFFNEQSIDILVNNTQGPNAGGALEKTVPDYQVAFDLLFKTVVRTTELALPSMRKNRWGRIINITSVSVKEPLNYLALSNTIRAAVVNWAKGLAIDVGKDGITVNNILTGYFDTERIAQLNATKADNMGIPIEEVRKQMEQQVPLGRIGKPEEYGYLVSFLASEYASYLTGSNIPLDGGLLKSL